MTIPRTMAVLAGSLALFANAATAAEPLAIAADGAVSIPALQVPSSNLMSQQGADSRVEHILTERSLKGKTVAEINVALFGPRAARTKAAFPVTIRDSTIGGVHVRTFEPRDGIAPAMRGRVLLHVHGGGFVGCFDECGALEAIPVAALAHVRVISIDYRIAPAAQYPAASEDVAAVYREVLKTIPARHIGLFGCSAGGTLTTQSLVWFQRHNLPTPAAAGVFCAGGDSSMGGDSQLIGMLLGDGEAPAPRSASGGSPQLGYMRGASTADAAAYPARDKAALAKFPPTLVIAGTRDFALSGAVNLHSKLVANGVDARLNVWEGGRHAFFYDVRVPEAREAYDVMAKFFTAHLR